MARLDMWPEIAALLVCVIATVHDQRSMRIPNTLTYWALGMALGLRFFVAARAAGPMAGAADAWQRVLWSGLVDGAAPALLVALGTLIVLGMLGAAEVLGMGDVKLLAVVGALLGAPTLLLAVLYTALAGGPLAVLVALRQGRDERDLATLSDPPPEGERPRRRRMPYAAAILIGTAWAILSRHRPELALL